MLFGGLVILIVGTAIPGYVAAVYLQNAPSLSGRDSRLLSAGLSWLALSFTCDSILT